MMKRSINFFLVLFMSIALYSCKLQTLDPSDVDIGYDYYPLEIGRYITYRAHDTIYNTQDVVDTIYDIKEVVQSSFMEGSEEKYEIYRFIKDTSATDWPVQPDSVWTVVRNSNQLLRTESNIEYIKLVFPIAEGKSWNGNAKNTSGEITSSDKFYRMSDLNKPYTVNHVVYPSTLKLTIANQSDPIVSKDIRYEIYAKGIGFIKRDYTVYYYEQGSSFPPQTIDYGSHKIMEITGYGKE